MTIVNTNGDDVRRRRCRSTSPARATVANTAAQVIDIPTVASTDTWRADRRQRDLRDRRRRPRRRRRRRRRRHRPRRQGQRRQRPRRSRPAGPATASSRSSRSARRSFSATLVKVSAPVAGTAALTQSYTLGGTPAAGQTWTLTVAGESVTTSGHTTLDRDGRPRSRPPSTTEDDLADFLARASGTTINITRLDGSTTAFTVTLSAPAAAAATLTTATPAIRVEGYTVPAGSAGDDWTLLIQTAAGAAITSATVSDVTADAGARRSRRPSTRSPSFDAVPGRHDAVDHARRQRGGLPLPAADPRRQRGRRARRSRSTITYGGARQGRRRLRRLGRRDRQQRRRRDRSRSPTDADRRERGRDRRRERLQHRRLRRRREGQPRRGHARRRRRRLHGQRPHGRAARPLAERHRRDAHVRDRRHRQQRRQWALLDDTTELAAHDDRVEPDRRRDARWPAPTRQPGYTAFAIGSTLYVTRISGADDLTIAVTRGGAGLPPLSGTIVQRYEHTVELNPVVAGTAQEDETWTIEIGTVERTVDRSTRGETTSEIVDRARRRAHGRHHRRDRRPTSTASCRSSARTAPRSTSSRCASTARTPTSSTRRRRSSSSDKQVPVRRRQRHPRALHVGERPARRPLHRRARSGRSGSTPRRSSTSSRARPTCRRTSARCASSRPASSPRSTSQSSRFGAELLNTSRRRDPDLRRQAGTDDPFVLEIARGGGVVEGVIDIDRSTLVQGEVIVPVVLPEFQFLVSLYPSLAAFFSTADRVAFTARPHIEVYKADAGTAPGLQHGGRPRPGQHQRRRPVPALHVQRDRRLRRQGRRDGRVRADRRRCCRCRTRSARAASRASWPA